ncbi:MAG: hypothetical protein AB1726_09105 [Planctomycetota bacterium]
MLLLPVLFAAVSGLAPEGGGPPLPSAEVQVSSGRLTVVQGEEIETLVPGRPPRILAGPAYLEASPGAAVEIVWRGLASLRLSGRAQLEWEIEPAAPEEPIVRVARAASLEVEARRGTVHLELPAAWALAVRGAALGLSVRAGGAVLVSHHGGAEVRVLSRVPRPDVEWPRRIRGGDRVTLPVLAPGGGGQRSALKLPPVRLPGAGGAGSE